MTTKHTHRLIFGRREAGCPRCAELDAGSPAVQWSGTRRERSMQESLRAIRAHNCQASHCGPVCTFGDW